MVYHFNLYVICELNVLLAAKTFEDKLRSIVIFGQTSEQTANERLYKHLNSRKEKLDKQKHEMIVIKRWHDSEFVNSSINGRIVSTAGEYVLEAIKESFCQSVKFAPAGRKIKDVDESAKKLANDEKFSDLIIASLRDALSSPVFVDSDEKVSHCFDRFLKCFFV